MLINIKILQGPECNVEVSSTSTIKYVKELVSKQLSIPMHKQKLVFKGKTLSDEQYIEDYNIVEGNKVHLFVTESGATSQPTQPEPKEYKAFWDQLNKLLLKYYSQEDANKITVEFKRSLLLDIDDLSLDDIERLAKLKLSQQEVNNK